MEDSILDNPSSLLPDGTTYKQKYLEMMHDYSRFRFEGDLGDAKFQTESEDQFFFICFFDEFLRRKDAVLRYCWDTLGWRPDEIVGDEKHYDHDHSESVEYEHPQGKRAKIDVDLLDAKIGVAPEPLPLIDDVTLFHLQS